MKKILVTGLCTLHWGRLQYGNVGNYYIVEPLFRLLHEAYPDHEIITTFQMSQEFIDKEKVVVYPMSLYYSWTDNDVINAENDYKCALSATQDKSPDNLTEYDKLVSQCDLLINVSGDMWGDNAEHVGHDRFKVDCYKMRAAQLLGVKTILYAVTPGPFKNAWDNNFVKEVFTNYYRVYVREKISISNLVEWGFPTDNVEYAPCPSFLFEPNQKYDSKWTKWICDRKKKGDLIIGMTFGGFNMPKGPYDMWPRDEEQYTAFKNLVAELLKRWNCSIVIFSHTNGFELPPAFKLINGRDFVILEKFHQILLKDKDIICENICLVDEPLVPFDLKALIGKFDILFTGRVHASVAGISQCIPTVFMEYDRRVIYSDKMKGFSAQVGMEEYVCNPEDEESIMIKTNECIMNREEIKKHLTFAIPEIKREAASVWKKLEI